MPTLEELKAQMAQEGVVDPAERHQRLAQAVKSGVIQKTMGKPPQEPAWGPELTGEEVRQRMTPPPPTHEGPELTDEEVRRRMTMSPEEELQDTYGGIIQRMAENYQTSPQYRQLLDQELMQISAQIAELTQRRNIIEMAKRGQG